MSRKAEDFIHDNIMFSAREAGLKAPLWAGAGCGGKPGKDFVLDKSVDDLAREARAERRDSVATVNLDAHSLEVGTSAIAFTSDHLLKPRKPEVIDDQLDGWLGGAGLRGVVEPLTDEYFLDY